MEKKTMETKPLSAPPHNQGKICVSIAAETVPRAIETAQGSGGAADVTEIRLDTLSCPEILPFVEQLKGPGKNLAVEVLQKPFDLDDMARVVETALA